MIANTSADEIVGVMSGTGIAGVPLPFELEGVPLDRMRWTGSDIVDAATLGTRQWFVDARGVKRVTQHDPSWVPVTCEWDVPLHLDPETGWRLETAADRAPAIIADAAAQIDALCDRIYADLSPSRASRYGEKRNEAAAYVAANYPEPADPAIYPILVAEAPHRPETDGSVAALADLVLAKAAAFTGVAAAAEAARARLRSAVPSAEDPEALAASIVAEVKAAVAALGGA